MTFYRKTYLFGQRHTDVFLFYWRFWSGRLHVQFQTIAPFIIQACLSKAIYKFIPYSHRNQMYFAIGLLLTCAELGSPAYLRWLGSGRISPPPPLSNVRTTRRSAKREAALESSQRGDPNAILKFSKQGHILGQGQVSGQKLTLFALSAAETRPETASANSAKMPLKG